MIHTVLRSSTVASLRLTTRNQCLQPSINRLFNTSTAPGAKSLPPRATLPNADLHHVFLKGGGPGGQKINKTNSKVQLTHLPTGIVVDSQATRSRTQNYKIAKRILAEKVEHLEKGDESYVAKKVERKVVKKRSREKKARRKYRALEEAKRREADDGEESDDETAGVAGEDEMSDEVVNDSKEQEGGDRRV